MEFESNVFINCPFDPDYHTLLRPLIYTIIYLGFEPQICQTTSSAVTRIERIKDMIKGSRFSIHDLSRCRPLKRKDLPRFNMPFELGLDMGCLEYGGGKLKTKRILILETQRYHYQKVLSDIAGQDIENHNDDEQTLITKVRNWFSAMDAIKEYPQSTVIHDSYKDFIRDLEMRLISLADLAVPDFIKFSKWWIAKFPS